MENRLCTTGYTDCARHGRILVALAVLRSYRRSLLDDAIRDLGNVARREREQRLVALHREIDDTTRMIKNLFRNFSRIDKPTDDLMRAINERAELDNTNLSSKLSSLIPKRRISRRAKSRPA